LDAFGDKLNSSGSYVREWVRERERSGGGDLSDEEALFVGMMIGLCSFAQEALEPDKAPFGEEMEQTFVQRYDGDSCLFEVGCYFCFLVDLWLSRNRPDFREDVAQSLGSQFIRLLSAALPGSDVDALFNHRLDGYGKLVRSGEDWDSHFFCLEQLLNWAAQGDPSAEWDFDNGPPIIIDGFLAMRLTMEVSALVRATVPTFLNGMADYFKWAEGRRGLRD